MDQKTPRKYWHLGKPPSQVRQSRGYRTRADIFADVWNEIVPFLESEPELEATILLDYLSERHPNRFSDSQLRTLQRRIKTWRAVHGSPKEVFFEQRHLPGHQAQSDFTCFNALHITINRQPFPHLFYHFCLIIHSLVRKPGAFERFRHRQQLFPQFIFRVAYDRLNETMPTRADKEYLRILEMAALTGEEQVAAVLDELFEKGREVSAESVACGVRGQSALLIEPIRLVMPVKVRLSDYDGLLGSRLDEEARR